MMLFSHKQNTKFHLVVTTLLSFTLYQQMKMVRLLIQTVTQWITPASQLSTNVDVDGQPQTPRANGYTLGYLTGDGIAPNGLPVTPGISFPPGAQEGDFALRLDYFPNRLFRFNGARWVKYEDNVRTNLTPGSQNQTLRSGFVNNTNETATEDRGDIPQRQALSKLLKPEADN